MIASVKRLAAPGTVLFLTLIFFQTAAAQTNLDGVVTADNQFEAYLSPTLSILGTPIGSSTNWAVPTTLATTALTGGSSNYIQIVARNIGVADPLNPAMIIGTFSLDSTDWEFVNGSQSLLTNPNLTSPDWSVSSTGFGLGAGVPVSLGINDGSTVWGVIAGIDPTGHFVWSPGGQAIFSDFYFWAEIIPVAADLSITKTDGVTAAIAGESITYTIVASNAGPANVTDASVTDTFPADLTCTFTSVAAGGATGNTAAGAGNLAETLSLPVSSSVTYTVACDIASSVADGTTLSNTANISSATVTDQDIANNSNTDGNTVVSRSSDLVLTSKTDTPDPVIAGTQLTYTITVNNDGPSDADNVTIVDSLPTGLTYVSDTDSCVESPTGTLTCNVGTLAALTGTSFDIVTAVDASLANNTVLSNWAAVGSDSLDPDYTNNSNEATPTETTVITEAYWDVTKTWTNGDTTPVNITLTCNDVEVDSGVATPGAGPTTLTVTGFDNGNTSCTVTEEVPGRTFEEYSIDCSVADVVSATTYICDITNAPSLATFEVRKRFMDSNNATQVTFNISCNDGLPLNSSLTVFPEQGEFVRGQAEVTFVVELFTPGSMDCTVWEEEVPNYTASYVCGVFGNPTVCTDGDPSPLDNFGDGPCVFENVDSADAGTSRNFCTIRNYPDPATYTVNKDWVVLGSGGDIVEQLAQIKIWCDTEIPGGIQSGQRWYRIFEEVGDFSPFVTIVPNYPSSNCWAEERIFSDAVESQNDCDGDALVAGGSASCDIVNTVFYEGIPTLNQYGLALLALLMLGVGAFGVRRLT